MFLGIRFNWLKILVIFMSFCCATAARVATATGNEDYAGPVISHQEISSVPSWDQLETLEDIRENQLMQLWGKLLLGLGFGHALLGIALVEVDPWGTLGQVGFSVIGGGIGILTAGMFCLGFSRPVHLKQNNKQKSSVPMNGMTFSYTRRF